MNKIFDPWSKRVAGGRTGVSTLIFPELEVGSRLDFQSVTIKQASSVAKSNKWPSLKNDKRLKKKKISDLFFFLHEKTPTSYVFSAVYLFQILCCYKNMIKTDKKSNNQQSSQEYSSSLNCSNTIIRFCDKNAKNILSDSASPLEGYYSRKKHVKITYSGTWKLRKRKRLHIFGVLYIFYGKNYLYARTC